MKKLLTLTMIVALFFVAACGSNNNGGSTGGNTQTNTPETTNTANNSNNSSNNAADEAIEELVPEEGATLLIWESKEERPFVEAIAKEFTEKYGVEIKFEEVGAGDQVNKLMTDGPAGLGADVVLFPHDNLGKAVTAGLVLPNDLDRKSTRLNSSHVKISYAVFCLKKK